MTAAVLHSGAEPFPVFGPQDHVGAVGTTRCGKTTLMKQEVVQKQTRILVIDTKQEDFNDLPAVKWKDAIRRIRLADWSHHDHTTARFRWRIKMGADAEDEANAFAYEVLKRLRNTSTYWDEIGSYCTAGHIGPGLKVLITQGGGRDLRFNWTTQRPTMIHADIYDNTSHLFVFHVKTKDRKAVRKYFPYYEEHAAEIPYRSYRFIYEDPSGDVRVMGPV